MSPKASLKVTRKMSPKVAFNVSPKGALGIDQSFMRESAGGRSKRREYFAWNFR